MLVRLTVLVSLLGCAGKRAVDPSPVVVSAPDSAVEPTAANAETEPPNRISFLVKGPKGQPESGIPVALITSADQSLPSIAMTDSRGEVVLETPKGEATVTAVTPEGFGVVSIGPSSTGLLSLSLDARCTRFEGTVEDQSSPLGSRSVEIVHLFPSGETSGLAFSAHIDDAGRFAGCLPDGRYFADSELDEVGGGVLFDVPSASVIKYVGTRESTAQEAPPPAVTEAPISLPELVRSLPTNIGVVALGESMHGSADFASERARITLEFAKTRPVRFVLLEASFGDTLALDRYVRTGSGDVRKAVAGLKFWMWDTEEFIRAIELIRSHNKRRPAKDRIGILGTDVQLTAGAVAFLFADPSARLTADERAALAKLPDRDVSKWSEVPDAERRLVDAVLARLAVPRHPGDTRALAAASIQARLKLVGIGGDLRQMQVRDQLMAEMTMRISDGGKHLSIVWAHANHVTRRWMFGQDTMGTHLSNALAERYVVLALLSVAGSTRAWDAEQKIGVIPHELDPAPSYSVERALSLDGSDPTYVLFSRLSPQKREWLAKLRYVRFLGSMVQEGGGWTLYDTLNAWDGAVVFHSTTSSTPTPTGVRKAQTP